MDECGLTTERVYAEKGQRQVGSVASGERGQLVTMIAAISAVGNQVPIFVTGYIISSSSLEQREIIVILVLDNHESHLGDEALEIAHAGSVIFVTLYPHTSHKTQSLDRTVFGPLKTLYKEGVVTWLCKDPGQTFGIYDISTVLGNIYAKAFSTENTVSGFRCTRIYLFNSNIFQRPTSIPYLSQIGQILQIQL